MKILYLSCHSVLEYDELRLLTELDTTVGVLAGLNIEVYSMGAYDNPTQSGDFKRSVIPKGRLNQHLYDVSMQCSKEKIHPELIDWADVIISMHNSKLPGAKNEQPWIVNNWDLMKKKVVVWRSIGQSSPAIEKEIAKYKAEGMKIVRYSPLEQELPHYCGADAIIRFYKDKDEFHNWTGEKRVVMTTAQSFMRRGEHLGYHTWDRVTSGFPRVVFGTENENLNESSGGCVSYEELKQAFRESRVYFYYGTQPAPYTLGFIEAMMTGIPIVAVGSKLRDSGIYPWNHYEIPNIIQNGFNGFVSDDIDELRSYIQVLLDDPERARAIGLQGRNTAISLFDKLPVMNQWKKFLASL